MNITRLAATCAVGLLAAVTTAALAASAGAEGGPAAQARAMIIDANGATVGFARLTEDAAGRVHVNVKVTDLTPGLHGIHIHAIRACMPDFGAAGSHHNPLLRPHGEHAGDLPNLIVNDEGQGRLNTTTDSFTLSAGTTSLFDNDGSAIIVHALTDDFVTQPTGGSGSRVACGEIVPG